VESPATKFRTPLPHLDERYRSSAWIWAPKRDRRAIGASPRQGFAPG